MAKGHRSPVSYTHLKCIIYDGGARRYEIHEHVEEVLEFWNGMLERADQIDLKELLDEKLGYPAP